jgi:predicted aspartyl protease
LLAVGLLLAAWPAKPAQAACTLVKLFELPVTVSHGRALVPAQLDGADVMFMLDTGAELSTLYPATVAKLGLSAHAIESNLQMSGIGGDTGLVSTTRAKALNFGGRSIRDPEFAVSETETDDGSAGVMGQNMIANVDVEYDLANGVIRVLRPVGCGGAPLAYSAGGSADYSVIAIDSNSFTPPDLLLAEYGNTSIPHPHTAGHATLNGAKITVLFDTGSPESLVSLGAAAIGGVKISDPDVKPAGYISGVANKSKTKAWIGRFASFKIGDEEIANTHILMTGDQHGSKFDMIIGMDFFMSHHVYVSNIQHKLYFTYNGGKVFDLTTTPNPPQPTPAAASQ